MQHKEHILSAMEFRQPASPKQNGFSGKSDVLSSQNTLVNPQQGLAVKTRHEIPQEKRMQITGKNQVASGESQYFKLQKLNSQQAVGPVRTNIQTKCTRFPFALLFPFILPQLDSDRAMQLRTLYEKLKKNEIPRDQFIRMMGGIVGNDVLKLAAAKVDAQSGVHKMEIQVPTPTSKHHTESVVEIQGEPPSMNLPYQRVGAQETSAAPYLHERVHPLKEKIAPRLIDTGRTMNNHLYTPTTPSPAAMSRSPFQENNHVCQKKPLDNPDSASQPLRKKQKTSVPSDDQSIEQLIDVTAVSGVNLKEEEERLLSGPKEDYRVSEASLRALQEEESLILQKVPLQKKMTEIMTKCGMNNVGKDVERCLSQAVEERLQGLLYSLIRFSKQRIDNEKHMHKIVITSDIRQHIMTLNRLAKEELEKEGEAEKGRKICERESNDGPDDKKEKDEGRGKLRKANKQEDDKMRTTNFAARAAVGGADLLSKWQLMAEQAQQIRGESQVGSKPSFPLASGVARRSGRNQMAAPQPGLSRSISVKDMISVLERETQMSKSTLIYNLYNRVPSNPAPSNT